MAGKLSDKQKQFVSEYLKDFNAAQAAIRVGYSKKTAKAQASRLLTNVNVMGAIATKAQKLVTRADSTSERAVQEVMRLAYSDIRQLYDFSDVPPKFRPMNEWPDDIAAAVSSIKMDSSGNIIEVRLWPKNPATELLMKYHDLVKDVTEVRVIGHVVHEHRAIPALCDRIGEVIEYGRTGKEKRDHSRRLPSLPD